MDLKTILQNIPPRAWRVPAAGSQMDAEHYQLETQRMKVLHPCIICSSMRYLPDIKGLNSETAFSYRPEGLSQTMGLPHRCLAVPYLHK
jgi:hypothetical protein